MNLLIAHKDPQVRETLVRVLRGGWEQDADVELVERDEGTGAVEFLLAGDEPCVAVVQWSLPGIDGLELCRIVRDFHLGRPPYIVLLTPPRDGCEEDGLEAGADACVRTPADAAAVRARVAAGMGSVEVARGRDAGGSAAPAAWQVSERAAEAEPEVRRGAVLEAVLSSDDGGTLEWFGLGDAKPAARDSRPRLEAVIRPL